MTFKVDITKIFTGQFENVQDNLKMYRTIWDFTGQFENVQDNLGNYRTI